LNPNQTHSPMLQQHVQKDAPCHAPGPYSFLQLWSSSCTSCTVPIIQQVKKMHKKSIQVSDHFCEAQTFAHWNFAKQIPSYLLSQPKTPKRHIPIFAMQFPSQRYRKQRRWLNWNSQACESLQERNGGEGARVLTNVALRPGMPPCPSLWVVFGTSFIRSAALRNFNGGSPTSSTTDWHLATFSSSAFRSRSDLPNSLAFLALASCSVTSFSCLVAFSCTSD
jgi:hypothetical protein